MLKSQIRSSMMLKTTEELIEIWQNNDRTEWSNDALDVVKELLQERLETLPKQNTPINDNLSIQQQAENLFKDYEVKDRLNLLLDFGLYICIFYTVPLLIYVIAFLISQLNPKLSITPVNGSYAWRPIVGALLIAPIFIARRGVKLKLKTARTNMINIISKSLEQKENQ